MLQDWSREFIDNCHLNPSKTIFHYLDQPRKAWMDHAFSNMFIQLGMIIDDLKINSTGEASVLIQQYYLSLAQNTTTTATASTNTGTGTGIVVSQRGRSRSPVDDDDNYIISCSRSRSCSRSSRNKGKGFNYVSASRSSSRSPYRESRSSSPPGGGGGVGSNRTTSLHHPFSSTLHQKEDNHGQMIKTGNVDVEIQNILDSKIPTFEEKNEGREDETSMSFESMKMNPGDYDFMDREIIVDVSGNKKGKNIRKRRRKSIH